MVRVVVTGMSLCSGLGNLAQSWQGLLAGKSAIQLRQPFLELPVIPVAMLGKYPLSLEAWRSQLVSELLEDARLKAPLRDCGIVVGSSRGFQGEIEQLNQSPEADLSGWLKLLPQQLAIATAHQVRSEGNLLAPMGACTTGLWALCQGFELLQRGDCKQVIVGSIESPVTQLSIAGFQKMGALANSGCYPFDTEREGLVLGEGGAMLLLETFESAERRQAKIYGEILGWSFTCDAHHISAPQRSHQPALRAIAQCLERSGLEPTQIDHIHPHGTSTKLNDQAEAAMISELFPQRPWVSGSKGATGHSLGASGIISAAFSLMMLRSQTIFPCVGLNHPGFDLNFVRKSQSESLNHALCFSFGFGGQNGVIAFKAVL